MYYEHPIGKPLVYNHFLERYKSIKGKGIASVTSLII